MGKIKWRPTHFDFISDGETNEYIFGIYLGTKSLRTAKARAKELKRPPRSMKTRRPKPF